MQVYHIKSVQAKAKTKRGFTDKNITSGASFVNKKTVQIVAPFFLNSIGNTFRMAENQLKISFYAMIGNVIGEE